MPRAAQSAAGGGGSQAALSAQPSPLWGPRELGAPLSAPHAPMGVLNARGEARRGALGGGLTERARPSARAP